MKHTNYLSVEIKPTEKTIALVKQFGDKNKSRSLEAGEAIAAVTGGPVLNNILQAPVLSNFFKFGPTISETDLPVIPMADFFDVRQRNFLYVWNAVQAGGLASNKIGAASELVVDLLDLYSAMHFEKKWARAGRTQSVAAALTRLSQEVLIKRNNNAAYVVMGSLAGSRIDGTSSTSVLNLQVIRANTAGVFGMDEFNALDVKYRDILSSWVGGTPQGVYAGLTDMVGSTAWLGQIRGIAYNPQNVRGVPNSDESTALAAPDAVRSAVWNAAGVPNFFGIDLHIYNEFGVVSATPNNYKGIYNQVFSDAIGSTAFAGYGGVGSATFSATTEQLVLGLNTSMNDLMGLRRSDNPSQWSLSADDQWNQRDDKAGFYGSLTEGFVSIDNRGKCGLVY